MLSAVAARKAALAEGNRTAPPTTEHGTSDSPASKTASSEGSSSSSKRKSRSSEGAAPLTTSKRAKVKETKGKKAISTKPKPTKGKGKSKTQDSQRYFVPQSSSSPRKGDSFLQGDDVIAIGSDSDSSTDSAAEFGSHIDDSDDELMSSAGISDVEEEPKKVLKTLARSTTSSMDIDIPPLSLSTLFPNTTSTEPAQPVDDSPLSSFRPVHGETIFRLSSNEIANLNLPSSPSSSTHILPSSIVLLPPHESMCIVGSCMIAVLHGSVSILGTTLPPSLNGHQIYAPKSSPLPIIRCAFDRNTESQSLLSRVNLPSRVVIDDDIARHGAVLLFQELGSGIEGLGKVCRPFLNAFEPPKWQAQATNGGLDIPGVSLIYKRLSDINPFVLPHSWSSALDRTTSILRTPEGQEVCNVYFVKGPKNTGKSAFARTLLNRLLEIYERVAYLECDLGQSEFTPGGMVALNIISRPVFGPPFSHPTLPVAAHYIGSTTPRSSPSHYLEAVQALLQLYRLEIQTPSDERLARVDTSSGKVCHIIPLIVNTMGWSKGLGSGLTKKLEEWAIPTDVFTFEPTESHPSSPSASLPLPIRRHHTTSYSAFHGAMDMDEDTPSDSVRTFVLESAPQAETSQYTAADHRILSLLSYFHSVFPQPASAPHSQHSIITSSSLPLVEDLSLSQITAERWNTDVPLLAIPPYELDAAQALDRLILTGSGSEDVVAQEIGRVLNGALVGLVACTEGAFSHWYPEEPTGGPNEVGKTLPYTQHCPVPQPGNATCVGLGLVRGVHPRHLDGESAGANDGGEVDLQLLTPIPPSLLATTKVFVKGEMELPIWGMLDFRAWDSSEGGENGEVVEMEQGKTPYLQWGKNVAGAVGSEKKRVRRNLMRRGQM